jgi:hypothetical protein
MGRPWQKCRTSEIHCAAVSEAVIHVWSAWLVPSPARCRANRASRWRSKSGSHASRGMRAGGDGRNLPDRQYPRGRARRACRPPRHRRRSSRRRWGHRPIIETNMSARAAASDYVWRRWVLLMLRWRRGPTRLTPLRDGGEERGRTNLREGALGEDTVESRSAGAQEGQGGRSRRWNGCTLVRT